LCSCSRSPQRVTERAVEQVADFLTRDNPHVGAGSQGTGLVSHRAAGARCRGVPLGLNSVS
jgi:hypothetical protein